MTLQELERLASAEQLIPQAPVLASQHIIIEASIEKVWGLLVDIAQWPTWYGYLRGAKIDGAFRPGARLQYGGAFGHDLRIAKVHPQALVMIYGKYMGYSAITKWELRPTSTEGTSVKFTESSVGFMIGLLYGNEKLSMHLSRWLEALKVKAELS